MRYTTILGRSAETVLEVGTFNTHAEFTAGRPNGQVAPVAITRISYSLAIQTMVKFNPTSTAVLMVQTSVLEVSTAGLIPYEASKLIPPMEEVSHHRLCLLWQ